MAKRVYDFGVQRRRGKGETNRLLYNPVPPPMMKKSIFNNPDNLIIIHTTDHKTANMLTRIRTRRQYTTMQSSST